MRTPSARLLGLFALLALALALAARARTRPPGRVELSPHAAAGPGAEPVFRPGRPFMARLLLDERLGGAPGPGHVDVELHDEGGLMKLVPVRATADDDELLLGVRDVAHLVEARRGRFRLAFVRAGQVLGEARFVVAR